MFEYRSPEFPPLTGSGVSIVMPSAFTFIKPMYSDDITYSVILDVKKNYRKNFIQTMKKFGICICILSFKL